jgi:hypothetical protein
MIGVRLLDHPAGDAAAGIAGRVGFMVVGIGVDDQGGTIGIRVSVQLPLKSL